jgi:predicted secreted protein
MTLTSFVLIYIVVWWVVIFAVLPIGVKSVHESDEDQPEGVEEGAPARPRLLMKIVLTSLISVVLTVIVGMAWPSIDAWLSKEAGIQVEQDQAARHAPAPSPPQEQQQSKER